MILKTGPHSAHSGTGSSLVRGGIGRGAHWAVDQEDSDPFFSALSVFTLDYLAESPFGLPPVAGFCQPLQSSQDQERSKFMISEEPSGTHKGTLMLVLSKIITLAAGL